MKNRFWLFLIPFVFIITGCAALLGSTQRTLTMSVYKGDYWGRWFEPDRVSWTNSNPSNLALFGRNDHPSDFYFRVTVNGPVVLMESAAWQDYTGTIEYWANVEEYWANSKKSDAFVSYVSSYNTDMFLLSRGSKMTKRPATIKVKVDKRTVTYNVFFDNVGIGVCVPYK